MQATQIKEGQWYAVSTSPRKGIDDLYGISAAKLRVVRKGVERLNPTGGEFQEGSYKHDGIQCEYLDPAQTLVKSPTIYKARDFLMPWPEYEAENTRRKAARDKRANELAEQIAKHEDRLDALRSEIAGYDLRHTTERREIGGQDPTDNHSLDFHISVNGSVVLVSVAAMERLMAGVAERIYEGIRDAS